MAVRETSGATISDVAAAAGVSRQTVSNVLNAPGRVAPATTERVRRAIDELGYRPNRAAQNLRERTSRCIGFRIDSFSESSHLLDRFLHALAEAAGEAGYHVLLFAPGGTDEELAACEDLIRSGTVDGFVIADIGVGDPRLPWLTQRGIPFVCFGRPRGQAQGRFRWVDVDGAYGVAEAVRHLAARGHRRIAYLGWPEGTGFGDERRDGWRTALRRHGLDGTGLSGECVQDVTEAAETARNMLVEADPPTAFVSGSDTFAMAARLAGGLDEHGRPRVEAVGFDDSPAARLMTPPMSSVRQPLGEVARRLVDLLVDQLHETGPPSGGVMLRPVFVARGRCLSVAGH